MSEWQGANQLLKTIYKQTWKAGTNYTFQHWNCGWLLKLEVDLAFKSGKVGISWDATSTASAWIVKQQNFRRMTQLNSKGMINLCNVPRLTIKVFCTLCHLFIGCWVQILFSPKPYSLFTHKLHYMNYEVLQYKKTNILNINAQTKFM